MKIAARVENREGIHHVTLATDGRTHSIEIPPKPTGFGSSANGGELLFLALATCYCNDLQDPKHTPRGDASLARRDASRRRVNNDSVGEWSDHALASSQLHPLEHPVTRFIGFPPVLDGGLSRRDPFGITTGGHRHNINNSPTASSKPTACLHRPASP